MDATNERPLRMFYDGGDYVIAYDELDADELWADFTGDQRVVWECKWKAVRPESLILASPDEPVGGPMPNARKLTAAEWIAERGRGWFCTENF